MITDLRFNTMTDIDMRMLIDYCEEHSVGNPQFWRMIQEGNYLPSLMKTPYRTKTLQSVHRQMLNKANLAGDHRVTYLKHGKQFRSCGIDSSPDMVWCSAAYPSRITSIVLTGNTTVMTYEQMRRNSVIYSGLAGFSTPAFAHILCKWPLFDEIRICEYGGWVFLVQENVRVAMIHADASSLGARSTKQEANR